jgi:hypothetical protein
MAEPAYVQSTHLNSSSGTARSLALPAPVAPGNCLLVIVSDGGGAVLSSLTSDRGDAFTLVLDHADTGGRRQRIYRCFGAVGGVTTVSFTWNTSYGDTFYLFEISATSITASTVSDFAFVSDHSNTTPLTNLAPHAMFLKVSRTNVAASSMLPAAGDGYTRREADDPLSQYVQTKDVSAVETNDGTWTCTVGTARSTNVLLVFEGATTPPVVEGLVLTIAGTERRFRLGSLRIDSSMNALDRASAILDILDGSPRPELADELVITEDGVRLFGGVLDDVSERAITADASKDLMVAIGAADFNTYADRRYVINLASTAAMTLKATLELLLPYLTPFGVTLSPTQVDGPLVEPFSWQYRLLADILNELAAATAYVWEIDYAKVLRMWYPGSEVAPFNIVDGERRVIGDIVVNPLGTEYANRVIAICGPDAPRDFEDTYYSDGVSATFALRYPFLNHYGVVWTFDVAPPGAVTGLDVRVEGTPGSTTYTYAVAAYNGSGLGPKSGANSVSTGPATLDAVNKIRVDWIPVASATGYVIYGRTGVTTYLDVNIYGETVYYDDDDHDIEKPGDPSLPDDLGHAETLSDVPGAAQWWFNAAANPPTFTRNAGPLPAGTEVRIRYHVAWPIILTADDAAEQAAHGIHEVLVRDENAWTLAQAQAVADNALAKYVDRRRIVEYTTLEAGLAVGQTQTLVIARRQLDGQFLITDIAIQQDRVALLRRTVTLQEASTYQGSWRDVYKLWAGSGSGGVVANSGGAVAGGGTAHRLTHEPGGSDPLAVDNDAAVGSLRTLGTGPRQAAPGSALADYLLLSDVDEIDVTTLAGYPGGTTTFLRADGTFAPPTAAATGSWIPLSAGTEPLTWVSDGAGHPILVGYTP